MCILDTKALQPSESASQNASLIKGRIGALKMSPSRTSNGTGGIKKQNLRKQVDIVRESWQRVVQFGKKTFSSGAGNETVSIPSAVTNNSDFAAVAHMPDGSTGEHYIPSHSGERAIEDSSRQRVDHEKSSSSRSKRRDRVAGPSSGDIGTAPPRIPLQFEEASPGPAKRKKTDDDGSQGLYVPAEVASREKQLQQEVTELKSQLKIHAQYRQQWESLQEEVQNSFVAKDTAERKLSQVKEAADREFSEMKEAADRELSEMKEKASRIMSQVKEAAKRENQAYREAMRGLDAKMAELQQTNFKLTSDLREKEEILAQQRNDIAKLSNERPDSKRDDHYFEQNFSRLFRSIQDWVLQYYLTVNPQVVDLTHLHPLLQDFLTTKLGVAGLDIWQNEALETIQAYIVSQIASRVLEPVMLGLMEDSYEKLYNSISPCAGPEEVTKWRIFTIKIISQREDFLKAVSGKAEEIAIELVTALSTILPDTTNGIYKPGPRTRKLKAIVEQAAKLAVEIQQEPSAISYPRFEPATPCDAIYVSDAKGLRHEKELQAIGAHVQLTVYPAVVRKPYDGPDEIVLVKAKVLATVPPVSSD